MNSSSRSDSPTYALGGSPTEVDERGLLGDRRTWFVLLAVFVAQLWTLGRVEGYQLADSVEYMDRAWDFARGNGVGPGSPRSFAFSACLLPIFAVAEWLGLQDLKPVVFLVRLLLMGMGLATLAVVMRMATRLYSKPIAWTTALLIGLSPVFLRYTISPLSGPAAMLCMALAFEALFVAPAREEQRPLAGGVRAGLWLGLGLLAAYQTLLVTAPLLAIALLRDRLKRPRYWLGLATAFLGCALAQCLLDLAIYGEFGSTLRPYLGSNVGGIVARVLWDLGLAEPAQWVYLHFIQQVEISAEYRENVGRPTMLLSKTWYLRELGHLFLAWPAVALLALGGARVLRRPSWVRVALALTLLANVWLMSQKGAKSFRLWLPILPLVALALADGLSLLSSLRGGRWRARAASLATAALVLGALIWNLRLTSELPLKRYGDFWSAMDTVARRAHENDTQVTVASSYHWATLFRAERDVELIKLSYDLDAWQGLGEPERERVLMELNGIDFLITHSQAIEQDPRIMQVVGERYRVHEVYWGEGRARELGPVYLLACARPELPLGGRKLFQTRAGAQPEDIDRMRARLQHPSRLVFERPSPEGQPGFAASFLGWELEPVGSRGELAWLTYYWWAAEVDGRDYPIRDRITDLEGRWAWNNARRAYGVAPTSTWQANGLMSESYLLTATNRGARYGELYRAGQWIPAELYLSIEAPDSSPEGEALPAPMLRDEVGRRLIAPPLEPTEDSSPQRVLDRVGRHWNEAGMLRVGADWLPVPRSR